MKILLDILFIIGILCLCGCRTEQTYETATPYQREMEYYKFETEPTNYIDYEELNWLYNQENKTNK